jgi:hypothetical protein
MKAINNDIDKTSQSDGILVRSYTELLEKIADLLYDYPKNILYFRGQSKDYKTPKGRTALYPSIYRGILKEYEKRERFRLLNV